MRSLRSAAANLVFWLLLMVGAAVLAFAGARWGRTGGPLAAPKWDGTYHAAPGVEAKTPERWKDRKAESVKGDSRAGS